MQVCHRIEVVLCADALLEYHIQDHWP